MSKIKAIIWDWGGVCCVAGEHFSHKDMLAQAEKTSEQMSFECKEIEGKFYEGRITEEEFWNDIIAKYSLKGISHDELREAYFDSSPVHESVLSAIKFLKSSYRQVLLSTLGIDMSARIRKLYNIDSLFDSIIFSHEIGMRKPDLQVFNLALKKINCNPEEVVFIDDFKKNLDAASSLGIHTIQAASPLEVFQGLEMFGIKFKQ